MGNTLDEKVFQPAKGMYKDYDKITDFSFHGRLIRVFETVDEKDLITLFDSKNGLIKNKADLEELVAAVRNGDVKADSGFEQFVEDLWDFATRDPDYNGGLWLNDGDGKAYDIMSLLKNAEKDMDYIKDFDASAKHTAKALQEVENTIIKRVISEHDGTGKYNNLKFKNRVLNYFNPHYKHIVNMVEEFNSLRKSMQHIYLADTPIHHAINKYIRELHFTKEEVDQLKALYGNTGGQLKLVREKIKEVFGKELSLNDSIKIQDVDPREIYKKLTKLKAETSFDKIVLQAEEDMDKLDAIVEAARKRTFERTKNPKYADPVRPTSEMIPEQLQIRFNKYLKDTPRLKNVYDEKLARPFKNADFKVEIKWEVTVTHSVPYEEMESVRQANGSYTNVMVTKYKTEYSYYDLKRTDTLNASYEDIINGKVDVSIDDLPPLPPAQTSGAHAVSADNGIPEFTYIPHDELDQMVKDGAKMRMHEAPLRDKMENVYSYMNQFDDETYEKIVKDEPSRIKTMDELMARKAELVKSKETLSTYAKLTDEEVLHQWGKGTKSADKVEDFRARNADLMARYNSMIRRIDHLHEQFNQKVASGDTEYSLPEYAKEIEKLRKVHMKYRIQQGVGAGTAVVGGAGYVFKDEIKEKAQEVQNWYDREIANRTYKP